MRDYKTKKLLLLTITSLSFLSVSCGKTLLGIADLSVPASSSNNCFTVAADKTFNITGTANTVTTLGATTVIPGSNTLTTSVTVSLSAVPGGDGSIPAGAISFSETDPTTNATMDFGISGITPPSASALLAPGGSVTGTGTVSGTVTIPLATAQKLLNALPKGTSQFCFLGLKILNAMTSATVTIDPNYPNKPSVPAVGTLALSGGTPCFTDGTVDANGNGNCLVLPTN